MATTLFPLHCNVVSDARFDVVFSEMSRCSRRIVRPERVGLCCEIEGSDDDVVRYVSGLFSEVDPDALDECWVR